MAFSWERVKKNSLDAKKQLEKENKNSLKQNIYTIDFFTFVNSLANVSDDVKTILSAFTRERLSQFGKTFWTVERYKFVIKDLLVKCCNKQNFLEVTKFDTEVAKDEIAFQCKCHLLLAQRDKRRLSRKSIYTENFEIVKYKFVKEKLVIKSDKTTKYKDAYLQEFFSGGWVE